MPRGPSFFRGSELPRLLVLAGITLGGWLVAWQYLGRRPPPIRPATVVADDPRPVVPDRSIEFETVTDWNAMAFRDNAAFALLLDRARSKTPAELAREGRRDVMLPQIWERPALYRGVLVHLKGTARRAFRYESKLSKTGWLYEAWIDLPDVLGVVFDCVFEEPPKGFPLGMNIAESVEFDGYFLKILVYNAVATNPGVASGLIKRGTPVLVGRLAWNPSSSDGDEVGSGSTLRWTLILLSVLIVISALRWLLQLGRLFGRRHRSEAPGVAVDDQIDAAALERWVESARAEDGDASVGPGLATIEEAEGTADSGTRPTDEAQSTSLPATGG